MRWLALFAQGPGIPIVDPIAGTIAKYGFPGLLAIALVAIWYLHSDAKAERAAAAAKLEAEKEKRIESERLHGDEVKQLLQEHMPAMDSFAKEVAALGVKVDQILRPKP